MSRESPPKAWERVAQESVAEYQLSLEVRCESFSPSPGSAQRTVLGQWRAWPLSAVSIAAMTPILYKEFL